MKLLTHNLMVCNSKACRGKDNPLSLKITTLVVKESEYDQVFVKKLMSKLNWAHLAATARTVPTATLRGRYSFRTRWCCRNR